MSVHSHYRLLSVPSTTKAKASLLGRISAALVSSLIFAYAALFLLYQIALLSPLGDSWWLRFYDIFGYLLYLPLPVFLLLLLFPGRRWRALALTIPLLFFCYEYGAAFTPKTYFASTAVAQAETPLRVMTWNTYFKNSEVENLVSAVQHERPDILAVQEFGADYAKEFAATLKSNLPYQLTYPSWNPSGYALFSRYPLKEVLQPLAGSRACPCIQATATINERDVTIIVIHPTIPYFDIDFSRRLPLPTSFDTYRQDYQHQIVLQRIAKADGPLLVVGDFNATDRMSIIQQYRQILTDSYREAGWGFGFTFPYEATFHSFELPSLVRLDYIFHDDFWRATRSWIGQAHGADHRYVVADLVLASR